MWIGVWCIARLDGRTLARQGNYGLRRRQGRLRIINASEVVVNVRIQVHTVIKPAAHLADASRLQVTSLGIS